MSVIRACKPTKTAGSSARRSTNFVISSSGRVGSDPALLAAIQRALHQVTFQSGVQLERAAKFQGETLGRVGNAAETALRQLSKSARTPPDAGQHGILDFSSLHFGSL